MSIPLCFENQHFLVADKPAGLLSVPARDGVAGEPSLGLELEKSMGRLWPVHRLDREVSGAVLFARTAEAHRAASAWFEGRSIHKFYEAWSEGRIDDSVAVGATQRWESTLLRGKKRAYESEHGKPSMTLATFTGAVEFNGQPVLSWRLEPLTGRSHQLRFELAKRGCPILGDALYGAKLEVARPRTIALRAVKLDFSECPEAKDYGLPAAIELPGLSMGVLT